MAHQPSISIRSSRELRTSLVGLCHYAPWPRRYVGQLTDAYPPLPLAARDSQGAEATALHPVSTERDDHEYSDRPARAV